MASIKRSGQLGDASPMTIAVVGAGAMGSNWVRVIGQSQHRLGIVVDANQERAARQAEPHGAKSSTDLADALWCDAVVIATSTEDHVQTALRVIDAKLPLLVEKPLATTPSDVTRVLSAAEVYGVPIMCGFVERFNPAVKTAEDMIRTPLMHIVALRHSAADPRPKSSAVYDLLIHDIDLALRFAGETKLNQVQGAQVKTKDPMLGEVADCILTFESGLLATLSASRLGQRKIRLVQLMTVDTLYEIDLLRADVTVYQNVQQEMELGGYRAQTIVDIPFVRHAGEPLALELEHFVSLVNGDFDLDKERASIIPPHEAAAIIAAQ